MKKENEHVLNDWVFSNNPKILLQNKEVSELKKDLLDKQKSTQKSYLNAERKHTNQKFITETR